MLVNHALVTNLNMADMYLYTIHENKIRMKIAEFKLQVGICIVQRFKSVSIFAV